MRKPASGQTALCKIAFRNSLAQAAQGFQRFIDEKKTVLAPE
jgi:hypothetical protein